jgi:hypothetical protein
LEAEELRDAQLLVAGQLDQTRFGPADPVRVLPDGLVHTGKRRSIYVQQLRKHPVSLLESFDLPTMNPNCLERQDSLVALQALHLMNDSDVRELAGHLADRVRSDEGGPAQQVERVYLTAIGRPPNADEAAACIETLAQLTQQCQLQLAASGARAGGEAERRALATLCHTIINSAAFLYID